MKKEPFGTHLMLDCYKGKKAPLSNMELCFKILSEIPDILSMKKITTPYVIKVEGNQKKDPGGFSGFVIIAQSHVSIHTFPAKGFASIDVYTCQGEISTKKIKDYLKKHFGFAEFEINKVHRGLKYSQI